MAFKRSTAPSAAAAIHALDSRLADLRERRKAVVVEIIELESQGAKPIADDVVPPTHRDALALLAGDATPAPPVASVNARLHGLFQERDVIDEALRLGGLESFRLRVEARAEIAGDIDAAWRRNIVRTAERLRELEVLARERAALASEFAVRTHLPEHVLECYGQAQRAAGVIVVSDARYAFLEAARTAGFID
jgi:hypothetical protein